MFYSCSGLSALLSSFYFFIVLLGLEHAALFVAVAVFLLPTHPFHVPSCVNRREVMVVVVLRPRLRLTPSGYLLGGALSLLFDASPEC